MRTLRFRTLPPAAAIGIPLAALVLAGCGTAGEARPADPGNSAASTPTAADRIAVEDPWVRATTGTEDPTMTAAFMVIDNDSDTEVTITGAESEVAGTVELHEMASVDGEMVMREAQGGIVLAPRQGQVLQPGGLHVMLMDLRGDLAPGDEVALTLRLEDGSEVGLTAPVKAFVEEEGHYHEPGTPSDHSHP